MIIYNFVSHAKPLGPVIREKFENFDYLNAAFISFQAYHEELNAFSGGHRHLANVQEK